MSAVPKDPMYDMAVELVRKDGRASISYVQRHLRIGYNRAARLIEDMEAAMLVSPMDHAGQRQVYPATQGATRQPRAVTVTSLEDRSAMVTIEGLCNLPLSESEARALWVGLGNHLCEPAGPGLDRRAAPPIRDEAQRMKGARITIDRMLRTTFHSQYRQEATEDDLVLLRRAIGELGQ